MKRCFGKKLGVLTMVATLAFGNMLGVSGATSAKPGGSTKIAANGSAATATTQISTANSPATGYTGLAKVSAKDSSGWKKSATKVAATSYIKATQKKEKSKIKSATGLHIQYYMGSEIGRTTSKS